MDNSENEVKEELNIVEENKQNEEVKTNVKKATKKRRGKKRTIIVALFSVVFIITSLIVYRGHYLQVLEIGEKYVGVFHADIKYRVITIVASFLWVYILMYTTNRRIRKGLKLFFQEEKKEMPKFANKSISFITAGIASVITSKIFLPKVILFFNSTYFGKVDPIYGHDIGYYLFTQPFLRAVVVYMLVTLAIATLYAAVYYIILINTQFSSGVESETLKKSIIIKQLLNNAKVIVILISILTWINAENLSSQTFLTVGEGDNSHALVGAGVTDIKVKVWGYRILSILMTVAAFIAVPAYYKEKHKRLFMSIASVPVYLVVLILLLIGYDGLFVKSNEYEKQKKYIGYNIENTRYAYGINVDSVEAKNDGTITDDELEKYEQVISNINTNSKEQVLNSLNSNLTNKGLYKYSTAGVGLYDIKGNKRLVYISPREITSTENSYTNSTYENTHGFGVIVKSASKTDGNGDLVTIQKDFNNNENAIYIKNPRIYFGTETNKTIVTNSKIKNEFDYPINENDSSTNSYDGKAGLNLNGFDKMILAISKGDLNLAFTSNLNGNSKILTNRNVISRAKKIMPYLVYDNSPYLVVTDDGKLVWVLDAYTTSNYYPYSQKSNVNGQELNYVRNSVKVLIDAYDGDVRFYITDRTDLIVMAYQKAFPDVFMGADEQIPQEISEHFMYPKYLYDVQAQMLKVYHNSASDVIYRANDVWDVAKYGAGLSASTSEKASDIQPYYTVVKTDDYSDSRLGLMLPYTIYGKQSLTAYIIGSYDKGVPRLKVYNYGADNSIIGPIQLDTQINQNEEISKVIGNLDVAGTKITKNIVLVPINNKMLYVEAIYQEYLNESNSLPKLKKVIVASGNRISIGDDIEQAITNIISEGYDIEIKNYENREELINSIIKANRNLKESTASSDYERIGKDIDRLQTLIDRLEELEKQTKEEALKQKDKIKEPSSKPDEKIEEDDLENNLFNAI